MTGRRDLEWPESRGTSNFHQFSSWHQIAHLKPWEPERDSYVFQMLELSPQQKYPPGKGKVSEFVANRSSLRKMALLSICEAPGSFPVLWGGENGFKWVLHLKKIREKNFRTSKRKEDQQRKQNCM